MSDVCIAVAKRLVARRETSLNEVSHLPLGSDVVITRPAFNDNTLTIVHKTVYIKDAKPRNDQYLEPELVLNDRSLVGKKSSLLDTTTHDVSVIKAFNTKCIERASNLDLDYEKTKNYNLVSFPFTTAEPLDVNGNVTP